MKAIIPVAGHGTRLRPLTYTQPKALIQVAGKTVLSVIIDNLIDAGVEEFVLVVGYLADKIRDYVLQHYPNLKVEFVHQTDRQGLGHAIYECRDILKADEPILIQLGDIIVDVDFKKMMAKGASALAVKKVTDPRLFGVADVDAGSNIVSVIEKPSIPKSNLALVGLYKVDAAGNLMTALEQLIAEKRKTNGEYQLTDALMLMIEKGQQFKSVDAKHWYDLGKTEVILDTNARLLRAFQKNKPEHHQNFEQTVIIPPVSIAPTVKIKHAIIGPNVTIGEDTEVSNAMIRDSIIGSFSTIEDAALTRSIIGSDVKIKGSMQSLNIGDNTEIDLSGH